MALAFLKPVSGNLRLRYARPGYDASDLTLAGNAIAFDSAYAGIFSIYTSGIWRGNPPSTRTKIVSWPTLSYVPLVTFALNNAGGSYSDTIQWGFLTPQVAAFQYADDVYGLDIYYDGIYWNYNGGSGTFGAGDHFSLWYWVHRMPAA
jgi:hypothetical protein